MSRTRKTDIARMLHAPDIARKTGETDRKEKRHHGDLRLIGTGQTYVDGSPVHLDTGGIRHGNNRHMYAKLKVSKRRSERRRDNRIPDGE